MSDSIENLPILPLDDLEIEYNRATDIVKRAVTGLLSLSGDEMSGFIISVLNCANNSRGFDRGFGLYSATPDILYVMLRAFFDSINGDEGRKTVVKAFEDWRERNGEDLEQFV